MKPRLYLAGPAGFSELGRIAIPAIKKEFESRFEIIDPFQASQTQGDEIAFMEQELLKPTPNPSGYQIKNRLRELNSEIGKRNADYIRQCEVIFALLDGSDVDSGTAAEIGFAFALGKKIYGYRGDFRHSRDNSGSEINLQVEYFIRASGGTIFHTIAEIKAHLTEMIKNPNKM